MTRLVNCDYIYIYTHDYTVINDIDFNLSTFGHWIQSACSFKHITLPPHLDPPENARKNHLQRSLLTVHSILIVNRTLDTTNLPSTGRQVFLAWWPGRPVFWMKIMEKIMLMFGHNKKARAGLHHRVPHLVSPTRGPRSCGRVDLRRSLSERVVLGEWRMMGPCEMGTADMGQGLDVYCLDLVG